MNPTLRTLAALLLALLGLGNAACGGGGGAPPPPPPPTAATIRLAVAGVPAGTALAGADVALRLPAGVTPRLSAGGVRLAGTLDAGSAELFPAAWDATTRTLRLAVASRAPARMAAGPFVEVECDVTASAGPAAADYVAAGFTAADLSVRPIAGATLEVTPQYR
jgi:hypothetical protein